MAACTLGEETRALLFFIFRTGLSVASGIGQPDRVGLVVDHAQPVVRPIQLAGLDNVLTLYYTVEDALVR